MESLLHSLAVVMVTAGCVSAVFHRIGLPVALGYILAGVLVGPNTPQFPLVADRAAIQTLSDLGWSSSFFAWGWSSTCAGWRGWASGRD